MKIENSAVEPGELEGKTLVITNRSAEDRQEGFGDMFADFVEGRETPSVIQLDPENVRKLLPEKRRKMLEHLIDEQPESITEAADELDRGIKEVHQDLELLEDLGILYFEEDGRSRKPVVPYQRVEINLEIGGDLSKTEGTEETVA